MCPKLKEESVGRNPGLINSTVRVRLNDETAIDEMRSLQRKGRRKDHREDQVSNNV